MAHKISDGELARLDREAKLTFDDIADYVRYHFEDADHNPYEMAEYQIACAHIIILRYKTLLEKSIKKKLGLDKFTYNIRYDLIKKWTDEGGVDPDKRGNFNPTAKDFLPIWHRQTGKTTTLDMVCTYLCDIIPEFMVGIFTPDKKKATWNSFKRIRDTIGKNVRLINQIKSPQSLGSEDYLEFHNGSKMQAMSIHHLAPDPDGLTLHLGWVDEVSFARGSKIRSAVKPMLNMTGGICIQTGKYPQSTADNHVYEYLDGASKKDCSSMVIPKTPEIISYIPELMREHYLNAMEDAEREYRAGVMTDEVYYGNYILKLCGLDSIILKPEDFLDLSVHKPEGYSYNFFNLEYYLDNMDAVRSGAIPVPSMEQIGIYTDNIFAGVDVARINDNTVFVFAEGVRIDVPGLPGRGIIYKKFFAGYQFPRAMSYAEYIEKISFIFKYLIPVKGMEIDYTMEKSFTDIGITGIMNKLKNDPYSLTKNMIIEKYEMKVSKDHTALVDNLQHGLRRRWWMLPDLPDDPELQKKDEYFNSECYRQSKIQWTHTRVEERKENAKVLNSTDKKKFHDDWSDALFFANNIINQYVGSNPAGATPGRHYGAYLPDTSKVNNPQFHDDYFDEGQVGMASMFGSDTEYGFSGLDEFSEDERRYKRWKK